MDLLVFDSGFSNTKLSNLLSTFRPLLHLPIGDVDSIFHNKRLEFVYCKGIGWHIDSLIASGPNQTYSWNLVLQNPGYLVQIPKNRSTYEEQKPGSVIGFDFGKKHRLTSIKKPRPKDYWVVLQFYTADILEPVDALNYFQKYI